MKLKDNYHKEKNYVLLHLCLESFLEHKKEFKRAVQSAHWLGRDGLSLE